MAMVIGFTCTFMVSDAEAARRPRTTCICMEPRGTLDRMCPKHDDCAGLQQHHHEGDRIHSTIPSFCEVEKGVFYLLFDTTGPTCNQTKRLLRKERQEQRRAERAAQREHREARRNNFLVNTFEKRFDRNMKRVERNARNHVRDSINDRVDRIFGF